MTGPVLSLIAAPPESRGVDDAVFGRTHHHGVDPAPPASEPTIEREEAATIGTGSHRGDDLTENTFRDDLGLPRRDNHFGKATPAPTGDLRPGGY